MPVRALLLMTLGLVVMIWMAVSLAQSFPWLGAQFETDQTGHGVVVKSLHAESHGLGRLRVGDVVSGMRADGLDRVDLAGYRPRLEPHGLPTFADFRRYLERQGQIATILSAETVILETSRGDVAVHPLRDRPLTSFPVGFWLLHAFGGIALLIGGATWISRKERVDTALLGASGLGFFLATWFNSIYLARELALPTEVFGWLLRGNHLALALMIGAILLLFVHYPKSKVARWPSLVVVLAMVGYQVNENLQAVDWPLHSFYLPLILFYLVAIVLALRQWGLSRAEPVDRASLRWVFLAILMSMGTCMAVYFLPPVLGGAALLPQEAMVGFAALMYLGLALGVIRYRLFQLEQWWFEVWFWFFLGLLLLVVDLGLAWLMHLDRFQALGFALVAVGWLYFPIRHYLWHRMTHRQQRDVVELLPEVVEKMLGASDYREMERRWSSLIREAFQPLVMHVESGTTQSTKEAHLVGNGEMMRVPGLFDGHVLLRYAGRGQRLFNPTDLNMANSLRLVARQVGKARAARDEGAREEQRRITRDLHDDVGNRLLSLLRGSESPRQQSLARSTLRALRENMSALDPANESSLDEVLVDLQAQMGERYPEAQGTFLVTAQDMASMPMLTPRQAINIRRMLDEAVANAFTHAAPRRVALACCSRLDGVRITIDNDGLNGTPPVATDLFRGRGIENMKARASEIGGTVDIRREAGHFCVTISIPLDART